MTQASLTAEDAFRQIQIDTALMMIATALGIRDIRMVTPAFPAETNLGSSEVSKTKLGRLAAEVEEI